MTLKTVKDLVTDYVISVQQYNTVKDLAIKWVKVYLERKKLFNNDEWGHKAEALMDFHNITEKDLVDSYSVWCGGRKCGTCKECIEEDLQ